MTANTVLSLVAKFFTKTLFGTPARIVCVSFFLLIAAGALVLDLVGLTGARDIALSDAIFTSASAVCVTGLIVLDTGGDFTLTGQLAILTLIQVGGLGITTFSSVFILLLGRRLSFRERDILKSTVHPIGMHDIGRIVKAIVGVTLLTELAGAFLLWLRWRNIYGNGDGFYKAAFHSISAYCNAGFSLFSDSLAGFRGDYFTNIVVVCLIIAGGIGFLATLDCAKRVAGGLRLTLHTKLVLITTVLLIGFGAIGFWLLERSNCLRELSTGETILASFFQSVSPRTAGFNTVDVAGLMEHTLFFIVILMFIGASPGSTGGGIKTTTFSMLILLARARLTGHSHVNFSRRTIPDEIVSRSITIFLVSIVIVATFTMVLTFLQPGDRFLPLLFETTSAYGTVGLSAGVTQGLSPASKILLSFVMYIGRIGPLTMAIAVGERYRRIEYSYAQEEVMVG